MAYESRVKSVLLTVMILSQERAMAVKKIVLTDNRKEPPVNIGAITFDKDSNGRLRIRGMLPKGMSQEAVDTVCSELYIGMKQGSVGHFTWTE